MGANFYSFFVPLLFVHNACLRAIRIEQTGNISLFISLPILRFDPRFTDKTDQFFGCAPGS